MKIYLIWTGLTENIWLKLVSADPDADADEEEGRISNENEKDINKDKERIEDDTLLDERGSPEQPNNEISISLLRAKNLSLLQSQ